MTTQSGEAATPDIPNVPCSRDDLIPEFRVSRIADGDLLALPIYTITAIRAIYGLKGAITAPDFKELEVLCCTERIKRDFIDAATEKFAGDPAAEYAATVRLYGAAMRPGVQPTRSKRAGDGR
jgi:hypothetical protein